MSQRARHNTSRPSSYKTFSETGEIDNEDGHRSQTHSGAIIPEFDSIDRENVSNLVSLADHLTPLTPDRSGQAPAQNTFHDEDINLYVDSAEDDLDRGNYNNTISTSQKPQKTITTVGSAHHSLLVQPSNIQQVLKLDTLSMGSTNMWPYLFTSHDNHDNILDQNINPGTEHDDQYQDPQDDSPEQAIFEHADRETQRVTAKKKTVTGKRSVKTPRKAKTPRKTKNTQDSQDITSQINMDDGHHTSATNEVITFDAIQRRVQKVKVQVHELNPIRHARTKL